MLANIYIKNFAIIDEKTIPFSDGFNVLSGETGAGKSILIDALGLQLGDRADSSWVRHGTRRCDIQSDYHLPADSAVYTWLSDNEFDDDGSCQLRRTLSDNGKSKCYINGIPTTVGITKQLGEQLVDIHGQHAHQSLTQPEKQLALLDTFAENNEAVTAVKTAYQTWQGLVKQKNILQQGDSSLSDKYDLLRYQLQELSEAEISENEFDQLAEEQQRLSAGGEILTQSQTLLSMINDDGGLAEQLSELSRLADNVDQLDETFSEINELIQQATIYVDEAGASLNRYASAIEVEPQALHDIETRMSQLHELARKHHISPGELLDLQQNLSDSIEHIQTTLDELAGIDDAIADAKKHYDHVAQQLSQIRQQAAQRLTDAVHEQLSALSLGNARFRIDFSQVGGEKSHGIDQMLFMFSPNPGQGEKPLHKIASGGELSRISLAIQVASVAQKSDATLIFDEVDSGVGGATAEVIGRLLKTLSQYNQIICVTHLAQVAAFADKHIKIHKDVVGEETFTDFETLSGDDRIEELARMSGGIQMDKKTREHAQNLLDNAVQFSKTLTQ